tara:strand:- start:66 stop:455 length:390 start_codon:yes stop_codon:yes gene_type:complete
MKKIISLSFLIVLVGCEQPQSKFYFECTYFDVVGFLAEKTLFIDTKNKYLKLAEGEMIWMGWEQSDSMIKAHDFYGVPSDVVHTKMTYEFNNISGDLITSTYKYDGAEKDSYSFSYSFKYECNKKEPMI